VEVSPLISRNWKHALSGAAIAFGLSLVLVGATFGWENRLSGRPSMLTNGAIYGVFAWVDDTGALHLNTSAVRDYDHQFSGTITTDGRIEDVHVDDNADDSVNVSDNRKTLTFLFHTFDGGDAVTYRIAGGTFQSVSAYEWGNQMQTQNIYLGVNGVHPEFNPFIDNR
jgi:hypothetical protein